MSHSQSENQSATTYTDNRAVVGEGGGYANNGSTVNQTNYVLDGDAIGGAFAFAAGASADAGRVVTSALNLGSDALALGQAQTDAALGFGRSSLDFATDAQAGAFSLVGSTVRGALDFGSDAMGAAFASNDAASGRAFNFGTDSLAGAFAANDVASARAFNFGTDALSGALSASDRAYSRSTDAISDGFAGALSFLKNTTAGALAGLQDTQNLTKDAFADAKGRGALTDKIMIVAIIAMAGVAYMAVSKK